jgi:hypothetical protein
MSLKQIVELLIDESQSLYIRAISLFEFQTAVYRPKAFEHLIEAQTGLRAPTKILRTARIHAAIKILEEIEAGLQKNSDSVTSIQDCAANEDYQNIFAVFAANGGFRRLRHSQSARTFDRNTMAKDKEAQVVANIVDFSYRYSKHRAGEQYPGRSNPGGVHAAQYVVRNAYPPALGESTIKSRWREYQLPAIFLYLLHYHRFDMRARRVSSRNFLAALLQQAGNIDELRRYFCAYQTVRAALLDRKYKLFPVLDLDLGCSPQLEAAEFSPDISRAFEAWINRGAM